MRYTSSTHPLTDEAVDAIVVPVFTAGELPASVVSAVGPLVGDLRSVATRFALVEAGARCWVSTGPSTPDLLLICVGPEVDGEASAEGLRLAAMTAGRNVDRRRVASLLTLARPADPTAGIAATENWVMGAYRFDTYRTDSAPLVCEEVIMWGTDPMSVKTGMVIGESASVARDLINTPAADLPPMALADWCRELASDYGFTVNVLQGQDLIDGGFGGLLGVGAGSVNPPVLIEIERGQRDLPHVALVGKGITFDSGGLSLKPTSQMLTMKCDMSGAASVVAALIAAERLDVPTHVRAYLACAENMPSGTATRIGDVLRHRNGVTTEVIDTDSEGRLVLGDALAYAAEHRPTRIVDIATLTSSTGLGPDMWAVFGTDRSLVRQLLDAGAASGEPGWEMPLWDRYASRLRSDVADIRNYDPTITAPFGAVLAAQYLRRFVGDVPWAHIDLALTVMRPADTDAWRAGANGNGARTLTRYLLGTAGMATTGAVVGSAHH